MPEEKTPPSHTAGKQDVHCFCLLHSLFYLVAEHRFIHLEAACRRVFKGIQRTHVER